TLPNGAIGVSTFEVTNGGQIIIEFTPGFFVAEVVFTVEGPGGSEILASTMPPTTGVIFNQPGCCPSCNTVNSNLIVVNQVTDSSAFVNWANVSGADSYSIEYGPVGFPLGWGLQQITTASAATLTGLNPCVTYEAYIRVACGVDSFSCPVKTKPFQVDCNLGPAGSPCTYTLELFNENGFGWNGAYLTVSYGGFSQVYNFFFGTEAIFTVDIPANSQVTVSYTQGFFEDGNSYNIVDPAGNVIFSDGTPPAKIGTAVEFVACADCPAPLSVSMKDVNATNATVQWQNYPGATGDYVVEYGPMGFTRGTGTIATVPSTISSHKLTGLSEKYWYNVYVQLACDDSISSKPVGPAMFQTLWLNDVGVAGITAPEANPACDLGNNEEVTILLKNYGQLPQTLFEFHFAVNGQEIAVPVPQDGLFTGVIGNDSLQSISFETTYDFSEPGWYYIEAWTELENDAQRGNDTFRLEVITALPKPIQEDFEDNDLPDTWTTDGYIATPFEHNNPTYVLTKNLYSTFTSTFSLDVSRFGPIEMGDTLSFDYRYVDFFDGTIATDLGAGNTLEVQVSSNCGSSYQTVLTINSSNHVPSTDFATKKIPLNSFANKAINVRFSGTWASGDYWLDLDNINVNGCPSTLGLLADVKGSDEGQANGVIHVNPQFGTAPFEFEWSNDSTGQIVAGLTTGNYQVTVTDANGCTDEASYQVGIFVAADEQTGIQEFNLFPNPTSGLAQLDLVLTQPTEVQVRILNLSG
ncbi:MAG: fibronectin type III domain-containing protein, partial [Bacteroidota bacterium]